jgi:hypothetical protein
VLSLTIALARVPRTDETKLTAPLFETSKSKVWIARAPKMEKVDPIGIALSALAEVEIHDRLPSARECEQFDALVVVAPTTNTKGFSDAETAGIAATSRRGALPVMAITTDTTAIPERPNEIPWRSSVSLCELFEFIGGARNGTVARAAA